VFGDATAIMPIRFVPGIQHRLTMAAGDRWVLLPHAYGFVDPLFSTGIAWGLRAIERLGLMFEQHATQRAMPNVAELGRYAALLTLEADQVDRMVAGAYEAMAHFDLFAAHAMLYFGTVSYAGSSNVSQPAMTQRGAAFWEWETQCSIRYLAKVSDGSRRSPVLAVMWDARRIAVAMWNGRPPRSRLATSPA
jgi:FADH2 O2-dependent halogenase